MSTDKHHEILVKHGYKRTAGKNKDIYEHKDHPNGHHTVDVYPNGKWGHYTHHSDDVGLVQAKQGYGHHDLAMYLSQVLKSKSSQHDEEQPNEYLEYLKAGGKPREGGSLLQF